MGNFTFEEMNLMCIYNTGSRTGLINSLREMRGELSPEETELRELTDSALCKKHDVICISYAWNTSFQVFLVELIEVDVCQQW